MQSLFYKLFPTTHFSKAHLEKLQLDASLPLTAPYKLFNNQKTDWIYWLTEQKPNNLHWPTIKQPMLQQQKKKIEIQRSHFRVFTANKTTA